jgi:hypothetical protein
MFPCREQSSAAGLFVRKRIVCGFKYARGAEVALRDCHHGLPRVVDPPKNFAVVAKRIQVARIGGDLNNGPCHAIFLSAPCWCPLSSELTLRFFIPKAPSI